MPLELTGGTEIRSRGGDLIYEQLFVNIMPLASDLSGRQRRPTLFSEIVLQQVWRPDLTRLESNR